MIKAVKVSQLEKFLAQTEEPNCKNEKSRRIRAMVGKYELQENALKIDVVKTKGNF